MTRNSDYWSDVTHPLDSYPKKVDQMYKMHQNATKGEKEKSSTLSNCKTYQRIVSLCQMSSIIVHEPKPLTFLSNSLQYWDIFLVDDPLFCNCCKASIHFWSCFFLNLESSNESFVVVPALHFFFWTNIYRSHRNMNTKDLCWLSNRTWFATRLPTQFGCSFLKATKKQFPWKLRLCDCEIVFLIFYWYMISRHTLYSYRDLWGSSQLIYWVVPPPSNSHHQDYYIFSRESL